MRGGVQNRTSLASSVISCPSLAQESVIVITPDQSASEKPRAASGPTSHGPGTVLILVHHLNP